MSKSTRQPVMPARTASATRSAAAEPAASGAGKAMNRVDLVSAVATEADLAKTKAGEVVDAVLKAISGALKQGQEVRLTGFGTFATSVRKATTGRNPRTGEEIAIDESTSVRFKASKALKDSLG